jgi:hypothetical protein
MEQEADEFIKWIESEEKKNGKLFTGAPAQWYDLIRYCLPVR